MYQFSKDNFRVDVKGAEVTSQLPKKVEALPGPLKKNGTSRNSVVGITMKRSRDPMLIEIRNKYTKELVDLEELVGNTTQQRNWRGIIIALLVIVIVCALIVTAIVLVTPKIEDEKEGIKLDFKEFMSHMYEPRPFDVDWLKDEEVFLFRDRDGSVLEYNCTSNTSSIIMDNTTFRQLATIYYKVSADRRFVLIPYQVKWIGRHSRTADYKLFDMVNRQQTDYVGKGGPKLQHVNWSPTGNELIYIQDNNIFYDKNVLDESVVQLTTDGLKDEIYNGVPDWLYEEEIIGTDNALWWSPDNAHLLYAVFNDTEVGKFDMTMYGNLRDEYVTIKPISYPKAGKTNPTVSLKIVRLRDKVTVDILPPKDFRQQDHYLTLASWKDADTVFVVWLNRPQNMSIFSMCKTRTGQCVDNYRYEADGGWVEVPAPPRFLSGGTSYLMILPQKDGSAGNFKHIALIDSTVSIADAHHSTGSKIFLTAGKWDVVKMVGLDTVTSTVYFIAVKQSDPRKRHLYSTTALKNASTFRQPSCLTCSYHSDCQYVDAKFSSSARYYVLSCKGPGIPSYTLRIAPDTLVKTLEDNADLRDRLENRALPRTEYFKIPISDDEFVWGKLLLPPVLRKDEIITYDLLMNVYGMPGNQKVTEEFGITWEHYLSSKHSFIIAYVDGRGSGGRGDRWLHANYKNLGTVEVDDTITAGRFFKGLAYVNVNTAIWGVSHGGYLTAAVLARGSGAFKFGISVAPVTDWIYYDSVYTERYMGFPTDEDNIEAYNYSNISRSAANFRSSRFMIVHGTGDDNVHFQNTAQLIKSLTEADVYFRSQIYPDQNHFLTGGNTRLHLYNTMEQFLLQCYGKHVPKKVIEEPFEKETED